jgi:MinD-like ATPase involved in chromosome partitioning or flagellar assembly
VLSILSKPSHDPIQQTFSQSAEAIPQPGQVITVFSAFGSVGRSTIALNVTCELALAGRKVLLIDADTYAPGLATLLNLTEHPAGLAAACRLAAQDRLTVDEIDRLSQPIEFSKTKFHLMTGLSAAQRWPEVSFDRLSRLIELARSSFEFVVIDIASVIDQSVGNVVSGALRDQAALAALEASNQVLHIATADPVAIQRHIMAFEQLAELQLSAEMHTLVNRLRASVIGSNPRQQISDTLLRFANIEVSSFIPDDPVATDRAIRESTPLALSSRKSPARQAIAALVRHQILGETSPLDRRLTKLA